MKKKRLHISRTTLALTALLLTTLALTLVLSGCGFAGKNLAKQTSDLTKKAAALEKKAAEIEEKAAALSAKDRRTYQEELARLGFDPPQGLFNDPEALLSGAEDEDEISGILGLIARIFGGKRGGGSRGGVSGTYCLDTGVDAVFGYWFITLRANGTFIAGTYPETEGTFTVSGDSLRLSKEVSGEIGKSSNWTIIDPNTVRDGNGGNWHKDKLAGKNGGASENELQQAIDAFQQILGGVAGTSGGGSTQGGNNNSGGGNTVGDVGLTVTGLPSEQWKVDVWVAGTDISTMDALITAYNTSGVLEAISDYTSGNVFSLGWNTGTWTGSGSRPVALISGTRALTYCYATVNFSNGSATVPFSSFTMVTQ